MAPPSLGLARRALAAPHGLLLRHPVVVLLLIRLAEELYRRWAARQRLVIGRRQICDGSGIDRFVVHGSLLSLDQLMGLGRVEKRTLWVRPLIDVLGGNHHLLQELLNAASVCEERSHNCMVCRWLPANERYHVLQSCLNEMSSMFGRDFVHFDSAEGEASGLFRSTWYCITMMMPKRPKDTACQPPEAHRLSSRTASATCTFTDMTRTPRPTLRVVLVNEADIRKVADGKLLPASYGFFNGRHAERYRMLLDFVRNFKLQLLATSTTSQQINVRSPFTSERVHRARARGADQGADGGHMKRVHSQPNLASSGREAMMRKGAGPLANLVSRTMSQDDSRSDKERWLRELEETVEPDGGADDNCFLRLHLPHYVGPGSSAGALGGQEASAARMSPSTNARGSSPSALAASPASPTSPLGQMPLTPRRSFQAGGT